MKQLSTFEQDMIFGGGIANHQYPHCECYETKEAEDKGPTASSTPGSILSGNACQTACCIVNAMPYYWFYSGERSYSPDKLKTCGRRRYPGKG
jgi:hypothetical protein